MNQTEIRKKYLEYVRRNDKDFLCLTCKHFHYTLFEYDNDNTIRFKCLINDTVFNKLCYGHFKDNHNLPDLKICSRYCQDDSMVISNKQLENE